MQDYKSDCEEKLKSLELRVAELEAALIFLRKEFQSVVTEIAEDIKALHEALKTIKDTL